MQPVHAKKTIGILGGMGPAATADFHRRIIEATDVRCDQDHLHVLIDCCPQVPDRTAFLLGAGADPTPTLIAMARNLEKIGAEMLVMPCNTADAFRAEVAATVHIPLLPWVQECVTAVLSCLPRLKRIGLLATTGTVQYGMYQRAFRAYDVDVLVPDPTLQEQVMLTIYGPTGIKAGGTDLQATSRQIELVGGVLHNAGAEALLLACTELSVLFAHYLPTSSIPFVDAAQLIAERVVLLAGGQLRRKNI